MLYTEEDNERWLDEYKALQTQEITDFIQNERREILEESLNPQPSAIASLKRQPTLCLTQSFCRVVCRHKEQGPKLRGLQAWIGLVYTRH